MRISHDAGEAMGSSNQISRSSSSRYPASWPDRLQLAWPPQRLPSPSRNSFLSDSQRRARDFDSRSLRCPYAGLPLLRYLPFYNRPSGHLERHMIFCGRSGLGDDLPSASMASFGRGDCQDPPQSAFYSVHSAITSVHCQIFRPTSSYRKTAWMSQRRSIAARTLSSRSRIRGEAIPALTTGSPGRQQMIDDHDEYHVEDGHDLDKTAHDKKRKQKSKRKQKAFKKKQMVNIPASDSMETPVDEQALKSTLSELKRWVEVSLRRQGEGSAAVRGHVG